MSSIQKDSVGIFLYKLSNAQGEILDDGGNDPMAYLHGYGNIVPGLEDAMEGKMAGDSFRIELAPKDGYGEYIASELIPVPRKEFGAEYFDSLLEGQPIPLQLSNGERVVLYVERKEGEYAHLSHNHPLAGQTVVFDVEIIDVINA